MLKTIYSLGVGAMLLSSLCYGSEPYDSVKLMPLEPYFIDNGYILLNKVNSLSTTVFIDVESTDGSAARYIASNTDGSVKVFSVNSWSGEHDYQLFLSNVKHENTDNKIVSLRMNSHEAAEALNLIAEVIFIDSSDSAGLQNKILSWATHLAEGGVIAGNNWAWHDTLMAVVTASSQLNLTMSVDGNYWYLTK